MLGSFSLRGRAAIAPALLCLLLSILGVAAAGPTDKGTDSVTAAGALIDDDNDHVHVAAPGPARLPHCSCRPAEQATPVEAASRLDHGGQVVDQRAYPAVPRGPVHDPLGVPALAAARTPAALQVFRR
ncbi:MAG TPA: hypothetical protein VK735_09175 [Pseudonocardia sp.]|uniref:hypothetical protein n=1 Tax=Pseudonocardia sp. TaxID=60912 RepID=UPI002C4AFE8A|nr:hypothetical protein [Pseudonocardia sp.]HTF47605.1 hypothetical protein [Pseudonocardia sp.]